MKTTVKKFDLICRHCGDDGVGHKGGHEATKLRKGAVLRVSADKR
jgi:hypothetical protein